MLITHNKFTDSRGDLIPIEFIDIPFTPKRVFTVNNVPVGEIRGEHAHYETRQYILCINGSVDVILHDGNIETTNTLYKGQAILIPEMVWDSQKFNTDNSEILVFCSTNYQLSDYILNFNEFINLKNNQ